MISKGRLKQVNPKRPWHKYLEGKTLLIAKHPFVVNHWDLLKIFGEEDLSDLCRYAWEVESEHKYDCVEDFIEDVKDGNNGFGFDTDEIILDNPPS